MLAIGLSIWGGDAASEDADVKMVPVGVAVTSVVLSLSAGIFATLELFDVWNYDVINAKSNKVSSHA